MSSRVNERLFSNCSKKLCLEASHLALELPYLDKKLEAKFMAKARCKQTSVDSFFGNFLYEQKVSKQHSLRRLSEVIDWDRFTKKPLGYYQGKEKSGGRRIIPPLS